MGMENQKIYAMGFGKIYPLLVAKAERKGRALDFDELKQVFGFSKLKMADRKKIKSQTGYSTV